MVTNRIRTIALAVTVAAGMSSASVEAHAQGGDGYLFREPRVTLRLESGYGWQSARSDVYDWVIREHTLGRRDFDAPYIGGELAVRLNERFDLSVAAGRQASGVRSEYRDWVGTDDLPIEQTTRLRLTPLVFGTRFYLTPRGRQVGRFAWIPRRLTPYVGAGVGITYYRFEQVGEFIDFDTLEIGYDVIESRGRAFTARAQAGFQYSLNKQFVFNLEGRYNWAADELSGGFVGFDDIDLAGLQAIGGIAIRF